MSIFRVILVGYFNAFTLNAERYGASLRIQSKCGKMRARITTNTNTFYTLDKCLILHTFNSFSIFVTWAPYRSPIPAISHLDLFALKTRKSWKSFKNSKEPLLQIFCYLRKRLYCQCRLNIIEYGQPLTAFVGFDKKESFFQYVNEKVYSNKFSLPRAFF